MSLDWGVTKIANYQRVTTQLRCANDQCQAPVDYAFKNISHTCAHCDTTAVPVEHWHPLTQALVWGCMATGMNGITEKNAREFYARIHFHEKLHGTFLHERFITAEDVLSHVGLHTNVSNETRAAWVKRVVTDVRGVLGEYEREFKRVTSTATVSQ